MVGFSKHGTNRTKNNGTAKIGGKSNGYRLAEAMQILSHRFRVQTSANVVHAKESEDRTPHRDAPHTHIFSCFSTHAGVVPVHTETF